MHYLPELKKMNDRAVRKANNPGRFVEHCSYTGTIEGGLVLHSANRRSTVMIKNAEAKDFVHQWLDIPSQKRGNRRAVEVARDQLVESYF